jgi:Tol biopolymer transport system component/tRNA A-37 threonylcarbamoyl transferase component Bud32
MALQPGTTLGPYEIVSLIGAGGMGEVYRARDPRLNRDVAIKVLPAERVSDEDRRRRFVQEAHAASALNHPHIVTIYEIESANGNDFIVMEYVRGKSLDALIPRHGMRLDDVLRIAIPVADALAAAHARGIIHRDLKPANVMVAAEGAVKVLDFGLAKLVGHDEDAAEADLTHTADAAFSVPGTIAGTAAYMSPEQATGGKVDARSDIFSFGTMLYEMMTGVRAFAGTSTADTLSAVLRSQPKAPTAIVASVPPDLEKAILRCLRKDPERRFQHMGDVRVALQEIKEDSESGAALSPAVSRRRRRPLIMALVGTGIILATAVVWLRPSIRELALPAPRVVPLTTLPGSEYASTFSPDGSQVAFQWTGENALSTTDIYVKIIGSPEVRRLTTDPADDGGPTWSPDGRSIAYVRAHSQGVGDSPVEGRIRLVSPLGGADVGLSEFPVNQLIAWSPDGRYLAAGRYASPGHDKAGIFLVPKDGGDPRPLTPTRAPSFDVNPSFSPDGHRLAYMSCLRRVNCDLYLLELDAAMTPVGAARRLTTQASTHIGGLAWTRDGASVIYTSAFTANHTYLWRIAIEGNQSPERLELAGMGAWLPATARGRDLLMFSRDPANADVYRFVAGRSPARILSSSFDEYEPGFSPDGRRIVFSSARSGETLNVWVADADGSGARQLTHGPSPWQGSAKWSPDARRVVFESLDQGQFHIWIIDADGGTPRQITNAPGHQQVPSWSHDGRWIYYTADEGTGRNVWRVAATGGQPQRMTSGGSGLVARESADGRFLLYKAQDGKTPLLMMPLTGGPARPLAPCVHDRMFEPAAGAVYYVPCEPYQNPPIHRLDPVTGDNKVIGTLEPNAYLLAVSPDGSDILYETLTFQGGADLMLIENFR